MMAVLPRLIAGIGLAVMLAGTVDGGATIEERFKRDVVDSHAEDMVKFTKFNADMKKMAALGSQVLISNNLLFLPFLESLIYNVG
jgi:hypothetical protein